LPKSTQLGHDLQVIWHLFVKAMFSFHKVPLNIAVCGSLPHSRPLVLDITEKARCQFRSGLSSPVAFEI